MNFFLKMRNNLGREDDTFSTIETGSEKLFQLTFTFPKSTIETLEKGVKYVQN